jgi:serine/threonine protein kinase
MAVFNRGQLPNAPHYFIDMELCDINLHDYIYRETPFDPSESVPVFMKNAPPQLKAQQIWNVMSQIASGVTYIHSHGEVHRD